MRRLTLLVATVAIVAGIAAPAAAEHDAEIGFNGLWVSIDVVDGSFQALRIRELNDDSGNYRVVLFDTWATLACTPPAPLRAVSTTATSGPRGDGGYALFVDYTRLRCGGGATAPTPPVHVEYDIAEPNARTMIDPDGTVWYKIRG